jgi:hypothetical protein
MERQEILAIMDELKLAGMRAAFDEIVANGLKRQHPVPRIVGELLKAEIAEKQARSIKYRLSIAKLPLAKELADFEFAGTPINEALVRELAAGTGRGWPSSTGGQTPASCAAEASPAAVPRRGGD